MSERQPDALREAMEASGLAAYCWTIATDALDWSPNATAVLEAEAGDIATGRSYAALLDPANAASRYEAVMGGGTDDGAGVPFQIEYELRPRGRAGPDGLWLEDQGRWFAGPEGRPLRVVGTVRRIDERQRRDQRLSYLGHCDPLTGLINRHRMVEVLGQAMEAAAKAQSSCALLICVFRGSRAAISRDRGHAFHAIAGSLVAVAGGSGRRLHRVSPDRLGQELS